MREGDIARRTRGKTEDTEDGEGQEEGIQVFASFVPTTSHPFLNLKRVLVAS
jgi:hypothetical protein